MSEPAPTYSGTMTALLGRGPGEVREAGQWHEKILEGLPFAAVEKVKARLGLTDAGISRLLGIGEATLRRARASGSPLDSPTGDRLYRLSTVIAVAEEVLESTENAKSWLGRAQPGLRGEVPLELIVTQAGADQVVNLLRRIEYGVYT